MPRKDGYQNRIELLQGTLQVETGPLYPALHRLERQGWVKSEWKQSENKQRERYCSLTPAGRKQLPAERNRWHQLSAAVAGLMDPACEGQS